jgi:hypothetical protein
MVYILAQAVRLLQRGECGLVSLGVLVVALLCFLAAIWVWWRPKVISESPKILINGPPYLLIFLGIGFFIMAAAIYGHGKSMAFIDDHQGFFALTSFAFMVIAVTLSRLKRN